MSFSDFEAKAAAHRPKAAVVAHIGGHLAFDVERIAEFCRAEGIFLIEDCAHAHGAAWNGRRAGTWGDAGIWSFAATKTVSTGEGGILVSTNPAVVEHARSYRNYGKPDYAPCHRLMGSAVDLPNTDWVATNHWCVPLYYRPPVATDDIPEESA